MEGGPEGAPPPEERPVFVLGTGRCGSTFVQTVLCGTEDIWVWGEHDGILTPLFAWGRQVRASRLLNQASYPHAGVDPLDRLQGRGGGAGWTAAWINGFTPATLDEVERDVLRGLFARRLPAGKRRWGFKEIRYAAADSTAEHLLALFPGARLVHVVRHPLATAESSLLTWGLVGRLRQGEAPDPEGIARRYANQIERWGKVTEHLLGLEAERPDAVLTLRIEDAATALPGLARFLGVAPEAVEAAAATTGRRNKGPALRGEAEAPVRATFEQCREALFPRVAALAARLGYGPEPARGPAIARAG